MNVNYGHCYEHPRSHTSKHRVYNTDGKRLWTINNHGDSRFWFHAVHKKIQCIHYVPFLHILCCSKINKTHSKSLTHIHTEGKSSFWTLIIFDLDLLSADIESRFHTITFQVLTCLKLSLCYSKYFTLELRFTDTLDFLATVFQSRNMTLDHRKL